MRVACLLHVCSDVPVPHGRTRQRTALRLGRLRISPQRASVKMLVDWMNRTPEQRTLNPRVRRRWSAALSQYLRDLAAPAHATRRAGQRRSRLRYQGQRPGSFPMFRAPAEESDPRSQLSRHPCRTSGAPDTRKAVRRHIGVTRPGSPCKRADPAWPSVRHAQRDTGLNGPPRPRNSTPACRAATFPAARPDGPHEASRPGPPRAREFPEIHPPAQAPPPAADRNASPRCPHGTPGSHGTRVPERAPGPALRAKPAWAPRGPCPWPSVKSRRCTPTVRTARTPSAIRPWTPQHIDPQRHKLIHGVTRRKRPAGPRFRSQGAVSAGGGRCWVRTNVG